jgi:hypothetical protein
MSVYVGIDVHRKRSQVAVVTEDGTVQLNKNVVNGSEPMLRLIGDLPSGTPVAFEAAFGWGWLADLPEDYSETPSAFGTNRAVTRETRQTRIENHTYLDAPVFASHFTVPAAGYFESAREARPFVPGEGNLDSREVR